MTGEPIIKSLEHAIQTLSDTAASDRAIASRRERVDWMSQALLKARQENDSLRKKAIDWLSEYEGPVSPHIRFGIERLDQQVNELEDEVIAMVTP